MLHNEETFIAIIKKNHVLMEVLTYLEKLSLPDCYVAAGCVFQTVWNTLDENDCMFQIKDIDIIYYDQNNLDRQRDEAIEADLLIYFDKKEYHLKFDVHNEARMHLWKKQYEGKEIEPYKNSEDAMKRWIATVHALGVRKQGDTLEVCAPFGLDDVFTKTIRPIKHKNNSPLLYQQKVDAWTARFSGL